MPLSLKPCGIIENWFKFEFTITSANPTDSEGDVVFELKDQNCTITLIRFEWLSYPFSIQTINNGLNLTKKNLIFFDNGKEIQKFTINANRVSWEMDINYFKSKFGFDPCTRNFSFFNITGIVNTTINSQPKCDCPPNNLFINCPPEKNSIKKIKFQPGKPEIALFDIELSKGLCCNNPIKFSINNTNLLGIDFFIKNNNISQPIECAILNNEGTNNTTIEIRYDGKSQNTPCEIAYYFINMETDCGGNKLTSILGPLEIKISSDINTPCSDKINNTNATFKYINNEFIITWNQINGAQKYVLTFFNKSNQTILYPNFSGITNLTEIKLISIKDKFHRNLNEEPNSYIQSVRIDAVCPNGNISKGDIINI